MVQLLIFKSNIVVNLSTRFLPWPTVFYIFINYDLEGFRIISGFVCSLTQKSFGRRDGSPTALGIYTQEYSLCFLPRHCLECGNVETQLYYQIGNDDIDIRCHGFILWNNTTICSNLYCLNPIKKNLSNFRLVSSRNVH